MSNQLRFNGKSIEEALAKARAALGEGVRLVAAERVSKPGFVGKRVSFTVVVEPPTTPISAPGFAAALRNVLVNAGPRASAPADADEYDYRSVQDELAKSYGSTAVGSSDAVPTNVTPPMATPKVFRRDGKVTKMTNVVAPNWSTLEGSTSGVESDNATAVGPTPDKVVAVHRDEDESVWVTSGIKETDVLADESTRADLTGPNLTGLDLTEAELVEAARRAITGEASPGAFLVDRIDAMVVDLSGDAPVVDLRGRSFEAETAVLAATTRLVAVVVPSASDPIGRFTQICEQLGVVPEHRFVLARRRREIPTAMLSSTNSVARSVMGSADADGRTAVLVDAGQLRLLRGSFLDSLLAVVVAVEGNETVVRLEREMSSCGEIDALWYEGDDLVAAKLGIARLRPLASGSDR
jgi:hypothetical protein